MKHCRLLRAPRDKWPWGQCQLGPAALPPRWPQHWQVVEMPPGACRSLAKLSSLCRGPRSPFCPTPRFPMAALLPSQSPGEAETRLGLQVRRHAGVCTLTLWQCALASAAPKKTYHESEEWPLQKTPTFIQKPDPQHLQWLLGTVQDQAPNLSVVKMLRLQSAFAPKARPSCQQWLIVFAPDLHFPEPRNPSKLIQCLSN